MKKPKRYYMVMALSEAQTVSVLGMQQNLSMSWEDGMVGVIPVFRTKKTALKYAGKKREIVAIEMRDPEGE